MRSNHHLRFIVQEGLIETDPKTIAEDLPTDAWTTLAADEGAKGLRLYAWAAIRLLWTTDEGFERWLLIRRSRKEPEKLAYYLVFAPKGTALAELAGAAGLRWRSRNASSAPKMISASTIARRAPGTAGTAT
ncbi:hypothetical protein [Mesorhizobium sp. M0213]|uniref:hypothetical protein n=1 Tax=Mesorhizobium sp. M0213 TaxID=2956917 RepID=UPI00333A6E1B